MTPLTESTAKSSSSAPTKDDQAAPLSSSSDKASAAFQQVAEIAEAPRPVAKSTNVIEALSCESPLRELRVANYTKEELKSALFFAVILKNAKVAKFLLSQDIEVGPHTENKSGTSLLNMAILRCPEVAMHLVTTAGFKTELSNLHFAAYGMDKALLKVLLSKGSITTYPVELVLLISDIIGGKIPASVLRLKCLMHFLSQDDPQLILLTTELLKIQKLPSSVKYQVLYIAKCYGSAAQRACLEKYFSEDLENAMRYIKTKQLCHVMGVKETFTIPEVGLSVQSTSASGETANYRLRDRIEQSIDILGDDYDAAMEAINFSCNPNASLSDYLKRVQSGAPVFIRTGWKNHATYYVIKGNTLIKCNRGTKKEPGLKVYTFEPKKLTTRTLLAMLKADNSSLFLERIDKQLSLKPVCSIPLKQQKIGNCTWASAKAALLAFLFLQKNPSLEKNDDVSNEISASRRIYKHFTLFIRNKVLEATAKIPTYLDWLKTTNTELAQSIAEKAQAKNLAFAGLWA